MCSFWKTFQNLCYTFLGSDNGDDTTSAIIDSGACVSVVDMEILD